MPICPDCRTGYDESDPVCPKCGSAKPNPISHSESNIGERARRFGAFTLFCISCARIASFGGIIVAIISLVMAMRDQEFLMVLIWLFGFFASVGFFVLTSIVAELAAEME